MLNETHPTHILLSLDALRYGEARSQVAFVPETHVAFVPPGDGHEDEETETWKLKMTLPRTVVIQGVRRKTFKVDLALVGQLCEEGFTLETAVADGGNFATTVQFSLQERRGPGTRLLWSDAQRAVEELHRLVDEPIDMSSFVWHDEETGLMRLRMKGFQVHHPSVSLCAPLRRPRQC